MSKIVKSQEIRKVVLGLALVLMSAVGLRAYDAARFVDCGATCGPCGVIASGCDSCEAGSSGGGCFAQGIGCDSIECDCGGDPNWECTYYEY